MTSNGHASGSTDGTPTISSRSTYPTRQLKVADGNLDPLLERNRVFAATGACAGLPISPANLPDHSRGSRTRPVPPRRPTTNHDATWMPGHGSC